MNNQVSTEKDTTCYHCGQRCDEVLHSDGKTFCCYGCQTVYEILNANDLCDYYRLDKNPGVQVRTDNETAFAYLDERSVRRKLLEFDSENFARVKFYVPSIHCVSCIWLLENLQKLARGVLRSEVNFARKSVSIDFNPQKIKLSAIGNLLGSLGYAPRINLEAAGSTRKEKDNTLVIKLAIAGFCFGNVMLLSFPEYLGLDGADESLRTIFSWLNIFLALPVFFYSGFGYVQSAVKSFRHRQINIDVPIAAGLVALFLRSAWDITAGTGPGYLDSFTGLVFFLLIGRWFQDKTYDNLAFDRDFKSYFPLAVQKQTIEGWTPVVIYDLDKGDRIRLRNMEIVPADSILLDKEALVDYSFVTGESKPVNVSLGEIVYAGGRLIGSPVTLTVDKKTSQSHLTGLWNHEAFRKADENKHRRVTDKVARKFTWVVLGIALVVACGWYFIDPLRMWLVVTSVLIVACPCALALSAPFTYGSMMRVFGRNHLYLKNADVIERMASIDAVVFDKTGTVTYGQEPEIHFTGDLDKRELNYVKILTGFSTHPLSVLITKALQGNGLASVQEFRELPGRGIEGEINGHLIRLGSCDFIGGKGKTTEETSRVYVSIDGEPRGYFSLKTSVRKNIRNMLQRIGTRCVALLSGDNEAGKEQVQHLFPPSATLLFNQSPYDKIEFVSDLRQQGHHVLMVGDGLNDAGALKQGDVGIAVTDDTGVFTPACDGILQGDKVGSLDKFLELAKSCSVILQISFVISFLYNAIAIGLAAAGHLSPLLAAILMPLSSISVVSFSSLAVTYVAARKSI